MVNLFVLAFICIKNEVLLLRRCNTNFGSGYYALVGGKVEPGETALQAIKREVHEEVTLDIPEGAFTLVHTMHRNGSETEFVAFCFRINGEVPSTPQNNEPDRHDDMKFFPIDQLPENILPAHKQIIECIMQGVNYSEHGW